MSGRIISVGICSAPQIDFIPADGRRRSARRVDEGILCDGTRYDSLAFDGPFALEGVTIGVDFHWQRRETQHFAGKLRIITDGSQLVAINDIDLEEYLHSVISSEMKATASPEFLKAHAVISRSWLLAQIARRGSSPKGRPDFVNTDTEIIRWADREDHLLFDVCADDHCQRYQGIDRMAAASGAVREAIEATRGQVLVCGGRICDTRFSKCCGGLTEKFSSCWENRDYPYLSSVGDPFCNTSDKAVLSQVLNDYDLETEDFHDWTVRYADDALASLFRRRSGIDLGERILDMQPVETGVSGRIIRLKITGSDRTITIGKELIIRKWLSENHLKSSAFEISRDGTDFVLKGRGWGHGVGLCQIGAAVMGDRGYSYDRILAHYFPQTELITI